MQKEITLQNEKLKHIYQPWVRKELGYPLEDIAEISSSVTLVMKKAIVLDANLPPKQG